MRRILAASMLVLAGCAGGEATPEWQSRAHGALERFKQHYLEGEVRHAEQSFAEAKAAIAATGRPELAARAELVRCALGTAALDVDACRGFEAVHNDATAKDRVYSEFIMGRLHAGDVAALPAQYRSFVQARDVPARDKALQQITDPVSRLIAAGAMFRAAALSPDALRQAIDTASVHGYRRPLLAYLRVQARRAELAGDGAAQRAIQQRIDLVLQSWPGAR